MLVGVLALSRSSPRGCEESQWEKLRLQGGDAVPSENLLKTDHIHTNKAESSGNEFQEARLFVVCSEDGLCCTTLFSWHVECQRRELVLQ